MTAEPLAFRPYVWKDNQGFWNVRVQGYEPEVAYKNLVTALVARGIVEPGTEVPLEAGIGEAGANLFVFRTMNTYRQGRAGVGVPQIGDHVLVQGSGDHDLVVGSVARVDLVRPCNDGFRVYAFGQAEWSEMDPPAETADWLWPGDYTVTNLSLSPVQGDDEDDW